MTEPSNVVTPSPAPARVQLTERIQRHQRPRPTAVDRPPESKTNPAPTTGEQSTAPAATPTTTPAATASTEKAPPPKKSAKRAKTPSKAAASTSGKDKLVCYLTQPTYDGLRTEAGKRGKTLSDVVVLALQAAAPKLDRLLDTAPSEPEPLDPGELVFELAERERKVQFTLSVTHRTAQSIDAAVDVVGAKGRSHLLELVLVDYLR